MAAVAEVGEVVVLVFSLISGGRLDVNGWTNGLETGACETRVLSSLLYWEILV